MLIQKLQNKANGAKKTFEERGWDRLGKSIKDYLLPDRGRFLREESEYESNRTRKDDRQYVLDDAGEQALAFLVSGFMSMLVPENSEWLKLRINNPMFADNKRVKIWLDDVTDLLMRVFSNGDVYGTLYNTFTEFVGFGTGCQIVDEDEIMTISPRSFTYGEYLLKTGRDGMPDTFMHRSHWSAYELRDKFGEDVLPQYIKQQLASEEQKGAQEKRYLVWHLIEPNDGRTPGLSNPMGMAFNSVYFLDEKGSGQTMHEGILALGGYEEFPVQAPRWLYVSNDVYGKESPGQKQINNIKMLQSITEDLIVVSKRLGDPPLWSDGDQNQINSLPGQITYGHGPTGGKPAVQRLFDDNPGSLEALAFIADRTIQQIDKGFFRPLFLIVSDTPDTKRMTATEVMSRNEEKFAMLSPILNRVFNELLKPLIDRTFNILMRQGFFDEDGEFPFPPELAGENIDIEFVSILAQAQKAVGLNNIDRFMERMMIAAQLDPKVLDVMDIDAIMREYGKNVPARIMREVEEIIAIREQRALEQQAMAQMAAVQATASASKDFAAAKTGQGSVLDELAAAEEA